MMWIHRLLMPFYTPARVAKILANESPTEAINVLKGFNPKRTQEVISHWSEKTQLSILNCMGEYAMRVLDYMDKTQVARALAHLTVTIVRKMGSKYPLKDLREMLESLTEEDKVIVLAKLAPSISATLVKDLPSNERISILCRFKPWVASSLMETLEPQEKAEVLLEMEPNRALDIFDRWGNKIKSEVLQQMDEGRREEILNSLTPRTIVPIISNWELEQVTALVIKMQEEKQLAVYKKLPLEHRVEIFPQLPLSNQLSVLKTLDPNVSVELISGMSKSDRDTLLGYLYPELADSIRKLILIK